MRDLMNNIEVRRALSPLATAIADNTAQVSQIIDMRGFKSLVWVISTGGLVDADATFAVTMDHGDDSGLSDAAAVPAANLDPTLAVVSFDFADDDQARKIGYVGEKRFVRLTITPSINTGAAPMAVVAVLGNPSQLATTAQAN